MKNTWEWQFFLNFHQQMRGIDIGRIKIYVTSVPSGCERSWL